MGTNGVTFNPSITMSFIYTTADIAGVSEGSLYIAWWDGTNWVKLNSTVNAANKTVTASITHFTVFALVGLQAQPTTTPPPTQTTAPPTQTTAPPTQTTSQPTQTTSQPTTTTTAPPIGTSTNWLLIGGIIAVALLLGLAIFFMNRPKKIT